MILRANKLKSKRKKKTSSPEEDDDLYLPGPDEINIPPDDFLKYFTAIYGTKGIGKTSLVASLSPKMMVFMFEPKRQNLPIRMKELRPASVPEIENGMRDPWKLFKDLVYKAHEDPTIDAIAIDSIDVAYLCAQNSKCAEEGVLHPGGLNDYGAMWNACKQEFESVMNSIKFDTDLGLICTSHSKESTIELNTGEMEKTYGPSCAGYAEDYLKKGADFAFFYGYHGSKRALHIRWDQTIWTACGVGDRFLTPKGERIAAIQMPDKANLSGPAVIDAFNNKPVKVLKIYDPSEGDEEEGEEEKSPKKKKRSLKRA